MSNGSELKKSLGLENFKYVKINRAVLSTYKILFVWFDSWRKHMPVTNYRIKNFPWVAHIFAGYNLLKNRDKQTVFTPPMPIEEYSGNISASLVIPVNLAGDRFINKSDFTKIFESVNEKFIDYKNDYSVHTNPGPSEVKEMLSENDSFNTLTGMYIAENDTSYIANGNLLHKTMLKVIIEEGLEQSELLYFVIDYSSNMITYRHEPKKSIIKKFEQSNYFQTYFHNFKIYYERTPIAYFNNSLLEFVTLYDLADKSNMSDFTSTWRKDRSRVMGAENTTAKLIDCFIDEADKSVTFGFLTESTELGDKEPSQTINSDYRFYNSDKMETDPNNFNLKRNRSNTYELQIKILNFMEWLDVFEGEEIGPKEMKEILEVSNVQVFSTSPSFHWQGMNFNLSQLDGSIYPTDISNPVWGPRHGDSSGYFLDKHLYGLLRQIKFWINPMASMLNKKLKSRGLI